MASESDLQVSAHQRGSPEIPTFAPRLYDDAGSLFYEDGRVWGAVDTSADGTAITISEWSSTYTGQGHTVEALRWLRAQGYSIITANGVGLVEDGVGDIATAYWEHMRGKGLVDVLLDDNGAEVLPGAADQEAGPVME